MIKLRKIIASELNLKDWQIENALALREEGGTVPFIARYRKERTGQLDENVLHELFDRFDYLTELEERKKTILDTIREQGKLTDELENKIINCMQKTELEDLYLPYKPKKRTKAVIAREKGLEPLAVVIKDHNIAASPEIDLQLEAAKFISGELGVLSVKEALQGAADIIAEETAERADLRQWLRDMFLNEGIFSSKIKDEYETGTTKYERYRDFQIPVKDISPHVMLALRRGETEGIVVLELKYDEEKILGYLENKTLFSSRINIAEYYKTLIKDAFSRLMKHSIIGEIRLLRKVFSDEESIKVFGENLRQILLSSPAGMKPVIGIDPGFRTGCKVAVVDRTGKFLEYNNIFPTKSEWEKKQAADTIISFISRYEIELIAIGNGTASRETDEFISNILKSLDKKPVKVIVSESGASIYSASKLANEEFPDLDLTVRGAISIARRLQDPLAELVKVDPKSIGVGQYQHDVDQKLLKKKLEETVESCVNYVGVDLNTASKELLTYVSGINPKQAEAIVSWRDNNGAFKNREQLMKVPKFGGKTFEQAAGFLKIRGGDNILDNTAVHPESYFIVNKIADDLKVSTADISGKTDKLKSIDLSKYITDKIGEPTLRDILAELEKPGRDQREEFKYAEFKDGINSMADLRTGMLLEGIVTNITNFGAFVDIGVHQDGLVHISEIADRFVKDPTKVLKVGQIVSIMVLEINERLNRISLSIKQAGNGSVKNN